MGSSPLTLHQREMAALARPLLAVLLLLGAVLAAQGRRHSRYLLTSNGQRELLKEAGNEIDHGNINLQRLDSLPVTKKKGNPKSLTQMKKKSLQKPRKKMEKQRLQKKREKYEKLHKKTKKQVP